MATIRGGSKLEAALREIASKLGSGKATLKVGFLEGATYPETGISIALVAASQNYGTRTIPARPFFTNMVKEKSPEWPEKIAATLKFTKYDVDRTLGITGEGIVKQLRQSIIDTNSPPLSPVTIARKGFDKPLIDTSQMINHVAAEVTK